MGFCLLVLIFRQINRPPMNRFLLVRFVPVVVFLLLGLTACKQTHLQGRWELADAFANDPNANLEQYEEMHITLRKDSTFEAGRQERTFEGLYRVEQDSVLVLLITEEGTPGYPEEERARIRSVSKTELVLYIPTEEEGLTLKFRKVQ